MGALDKGGPVGWVGKECLDGAIFGPYFVPEEVVTMLSLPHGLCGWKVCAQQYQVPGGKVSRSLGTLPFGPCTGHNGFLQRHPANEQGAGEPGKEGQGFTFDQTKNPRRRNNGDASLESGMGTGRMRTFPTCS